MKLNTKAAVSAPFNDDEMCWASPKQEAFGRKAGRRETGNRAIQGVSRASI